MIYIWHKWDIKLIPLTLLESYLEPVKPRKHQAINLSTSAGINSLYSSFKNRKWN